MKFVEDATTQLHGKRVSVHRNITKNVWSVISRSGDDYGRVVTHTHRIDLAHVEFRVSESGRQRVLQTKQKNVHAQVFGVVRTDMFIGDDRPIYHTSEVTYNPYRFDSFVDVDNGLPVRTANKVCFLPDGKVVYG